METAKEIKLTDAELQLIQLKREEAELNAKKEAAARQIKEGEEIQKKRKQIESDQKRDAQLVAELGVLFKELPAGYELMDCSKEQVYECYHYDSSKPDDERCQYYFKEVVKRVAEKIVHTESGSVITAHFYSVSNGKWYGSTEKGIRFKLDIPRAWSRKNDNLSSAKTIDKKIKEHVAAQKLKQATAQAKLEGIEWLVKQVVEMYSQATVTQEQESGYYLDSFRRRDYREGSKYVKAVFTSGLVLTFTWGKSEEGLQVVRKGYDLSKVSSEKVESFINSLI